MAATAMTSRPGKFRERPARAVPERHDRDRLQASCAIAPRPFETRSRSRRPHPPRRAARPARAAGPAGSSTVAEAAHAVDRPRSRRRARAHSAAVRHRRRSRRSPRSSRRTASARSAPTATGIASAPADHARLVADRPARNRPSARRGARALRAPRSRAARRRPGGRGARSSPASQITNGVLPVPPTVRLPTTTTRRRER